MKILPNKRQDFHPLRVHGMEQLIHFFFANIYHQDFVLRKDINMVPPYFFSNRHTPHIHFRQACIRWQDKNFANPTHLTFLAKEQLYFLGLLPKFFLKLPNNGNED